MARISRREFLRQAGQAGLAVGIGAQLGGLWGCSGSGQSVVQPTGSYDAIIVGGGTAGAIVATKLQTAGGGRKRILIIEAGGPTSAAIGGTDFPPWLPPGRTDLTIFDVPGEYSQMAFMPLGKPYQLTETAIHLSRHRLGRQFHVQRHAVPDQSAAGVRQQLAGRMALGRHAAVLRPRPQPGAGNEYAVDRRRSRRLTGPAMIAHPLYARAGWVEGDTSQPVHRAGRIQPAVRRGDQRPSRGADQRILLRESTPGGVPASGLEILQFSKANRIDFDTTGARDRGALHAARPLWTSRRRARPAPHDCARVDCW